MKALSESFRLSPLKSSTPNALSNDNFFKVAWRSCKVSSTKQKTTGLQIMTDHGRTCRRFLLRMSYFVNDYRNSRIPALHPWNVTDFQGWVQGCVKNLNTKKHIGRCALLWRCRIWWHREEGPPLSPRTCLLLPKKEYRHLERTS